MPLDGLTLHFLKEELKQNIIGCRVDKIHQPSKDELVFHLRDRNGAKKLFFSASANSPRLHMIVNPPENPAVPPNFCMLMRKHLQSALITDVRQKGLDRIICIDFSATNELGDKVELTLYTEIMAKHSNIILVNGEGRILDAIKRVDYSKSSVRQIFPGREYIDPPAQDKINLLESDADACYQKICKLEAMTLSSAILKTLQGVSPLIARETAGKCGADIQVGCMDEESRERLKIALRELEFKLKNNSSEPTMLKDEALKPHDFSFMPITQYSGLYENVSEQSYSLLLEEFYSERDRIDRTHQRSADLQKNLSSLMARTSRRVNNQKAELAACDDKDKLKINAELITAYQYNLEKGSLFYEVENYYDNNNIIRIPANPALSPSANAQRYYKEYRKAKTAQQLLAKLIEQGEEELEYIDSAIDALSRASGFAEIDEIRQELADSGYLKRRTQNKKRTLQRASAPLEYESSDGFRILVGRNNVQNDKLSLKTAAKSDMWLHTQNIPGSHVIICAQGQEIPQSTLKEAAMIAAYHSRARESSNVPIDYTQVKNLKKPAGAKPGKVIYHVYNTAYATPVKDEVERLSKEMK